jgi:hypothetical protein
MLNKVGWWLGAGVVLGAFVQSGVPIPGIPPLNAPGTFLNIALWPVELLAGLLGRPIYLQGGASVQNPPAQGVSVMVPGVGTSSPTLTVTQW